MPTRKPKPTAAAKSGMNAAGKAADDSSIEPTRQASNALGESTSLLVVGIGASAGGLAAVEEFLEAFPAGEAAGMALVLAQHLDPDHKSLLLDLVRRYTDMEVSWVEDGVQLSPGRVYLMPPNADMTVEGGRLILAQPRAARGLRLPIDHFLRSLAADQQDHAVCVVLSGTGSDGTEGVRAIKGEGGIAIAQRPETASYDGMPGSAIATGLVDFVLAPSQMPERLMALAGNRASDGVRQPVDDPQTDVDWLLAILHILRDRTGHDFSHYKTSTMRRRVQRRMVVRNMETIDAYAVLLQADSLEVETLFRDLLIGVTNFFRDPLAFEALADKALTQIIAAHDYDDPIRAWVPGCSTGEEAYSIAMLLMEQIALSDRNMSVQVFATDLDIEAIEVARVGVYRDTIAADVSAERLERFFTQEGGTYRVIKSVRDSLVFAKQDVTKDPPFSRVDLISCRNLLIYMNGDLQQKLMPLFHYALKPNGYLFLGTSETVGAAELFSSVDKKWKLFQRRGSVSPQQLLQTSMPTQNSTGSRNAPQLQPLPLRVRVRDLAEKTLLEEHAPACVVIDADGDVLYIHGHTGRYLEPAAGEPSGSLFKMARQGLRIELASGVRKVLIEKAPVRYERLRVVADGVVSLVNLIVEPMSGKGAVEGVLLVIFEDVPCPEDVKESSGAEPAADREQRIADLDRELSVKEEYLRSTVEQLETSNEELKSTNEEMQSTNEELQSTNEELETSREELQSLNEELVTVNTELQQMIQELSRSNDDMNNMLAGTGIGTLFVDQHLLIRRFTPKISEIMNLIPTDLGRPLSDISARLVEGADLVATGTAVLDSLAAIEDEIATGDGRTFLMRSQPYRTTENVIEGAVFTFVDVTDQRHLQDELDEVSAAATEAGEFAQSVLNTIREPKLVLDANLVVVTASQAFLSTFDLSADDVVGLPLVEVDGGVWNDAGLLERLADVFEKKRTLEDHQFVPATGSHAGIALELNALELLRAPHLRPLILLTVMDAEGAE